VLLRGGTDWGAARVYAAPVLTWGFATALATAFSRDPATSFFGVYFRQFGLEGLLACICLYFLLTTTLRGQPDALRLLRLLVIVAALVGAYACLQYAGIDPGGWFQDKPFERVFSFLGNAVLAGDLLALLLPLAVILALLARSTWGRALGWSAVPVVALGMIFTHSRGAWAGAAAGILTILALLPWLFRPKAALPPREAERATARFQSLLKWTSAGAVGLLSLGISLGFFVLARSAFAWVVGIAVLGGLVALAFWFYSQDGRRAARRLLWLTAAALLGVGLAAGIKHGLAPHSKTATRLLYAFDPSKSSRLLIWRDTMGVVAEHPWLGTGPEAFGPAFRPFKSLEAETMESGMGYDNPHNNFLNVLATTGVVGLGAFLWLLGRFLRRNVRVLKDVMRSRQEQLVSAAFVATTVSYVVWSSFAFDTIGTYLPLFSILAASAVWARGSEPSAPKTAALSPRRKLLGAMALVLVVPLGAAAFWSALRVYRADAALSDGLEHRKAGRHEQALEAFQTARDRNPLESFYRIAVAGGFLDLARATKNLQERKALLEKAEQALNEAHAHNWQPEKVYQVLTQVREMLGNREGAIDAAKKGLEWTPHKAPLRASLGILQLQKGDREGALENLQAALVTDTQNFAAFLGLGVIFFERGDLANARKHLEAAQRKKPKDPRVQQYLSRLADAERRKAGPPG
jgi:tetratricopeptide (TPR) repeat protein